MWLCETCGRKFKKKNQSHYCKSIDTVGEYIELFSSEEQIQLKELRKIIKDVAPDAKETISWKMPTFVQNGNLVHFAMHKNHIGLYVGETAVKNFENELKSYTYSKGTIQFTKDEILPQNLIKAIVEFNIEKNANK